MSTTFISQELDDRFRKIVKEEAELTSLLNSTAVMAASRLDLTQSLSGRSPCKLAHKTQDFQTTKWKVNSSSLINIASKQLLAEQSEALKTTQVVQHGSARRNGPDTRFEDRMDVCNFSVRDLQQMVLRDKLVKRQKQLFLNYGIKVRQLK